MMHHCTMEELLAVRDNEGAAAATAHVAGCERCQREVEMLAQRAAALRALPGRRPPRDRWPVVREAAQAERQRSRLARAGWGALAVAAGLALAVGVRSVDVIPGTGPVDDRPGARLAGSGPASDAQSPRLADLMEQSRQLEAALNSYRPDGRVLSGRAASIIAELEDRIAVVDAGIERAKARRGTDAQLVNLWRDRVQLMDALVSTHVTRAAYVGF